MFDDQFAVEPDAQKLLMEPLLGGQKGSRAHVLWFRLRVSNVDFSFVWKSWVSNSIKQNLSSGTLNVLKEPKGDPV